ncbi:sulfatase [Pelagicoccus mobilis]|uniref:Sulfatase n=1 Tax=Pelagicoccus mobilis TaxID=415221 RepID=A0A934VT33_9BACT|nr:sulfatase [Pelagicoccus mobilis]MBK1879650.1 sulfatase [Pelagicoccus mobilis]
MTSLRPLLALASTIIIALSTQASERYNVLLISIDDLNDWTGSLGGHPQANTPNIDRLAADGILFENAHCQAPVCQPSRASYMTSRYPSSTGLYFLNPGIRSSPALEGSLTLPERFAKEGYKIMAGGKVFHSTESEEILDPIGEYAGRMGGFGPIPEEKISQPFGHPLWDWGVYPENDDELPDYKVAKWAEKRLLEEHDQPFFMAVGFFRPHVPMYAPKKWFDQFPRDQVMLPEVKDDDRTDLPSYGENLTRLEHVSPPHQWLVESGEWKHAVQAYLATTTFADYCLGIVLDALERSPHKDNTIIALVSDHGFHLGEKSHWAKRTLWEDGTRVPLIFAGPGVKPELRSNRSVGLIDLYPTLLELNGLDADPKHEGLSLMPLIEDPETKWNRPIRTTFGKGNHALRNQRWRYIRYADGSEELYDHKNDPNEWDNLASNPEYSKIKRRLAKHLPTSEQPILGKGSTGHKALSATEAALRKQ